jgi:hypothetical protein
MNVNDFIIFCRLFGNHTVFRRDWAVPFRQPHNAEKFAGHDSRNKAASKTNQPDSVVCYGIALAAYRSSQTSPPGGKGDDLQFLTF